MTITKVAGPDEKKSVGLAESLKAALPEEIARTLIEALAGIRPEDFGKVPVLGQSIKGFSEEGLTLLEAYISDALGQVHKDLFGGEEIVEPVCPTAPLFPDRRLDDEAYSEAMNDWRQAYEDFVIEDKQYEKDLQTYNHWRAEKARMWENLHALYALESELKDYFSVNNSVLPAEMMAATHTEVVKVGTPSRGEND